MNFLDQYVTNPDFVIALICVNILFFIATAIVAALECKNYITTIFCNVITTVVTFAGIAIFDSISAMVASIIAAMIATVLTLCVVIAIIGFIFSIFGIYSVIKKITNKQIISNTTN